MPIEFRFKLDEQFDGPLLARIKEMANGSSENNAARFLLRYWSEAERQKSPHLGQSLTPQKGQTEGDLENQVTDALASMDW